MHFSDLVREVLFVLFLLFLFLFFFSAETSQTQRINDYVYLSHTQMATSLRLRVRNGRVVERVKEPEMVEDQDEHVFWI